MVRQCAWGHVGSLSVFAWCPFTEIAQKATGMLPASHPVGTEKWNQFIAISTYFFNVIQMGEN